jgi:hypothetical protein
MIRIRISLVRVIVTGILSSPNACCAARAVAAAGVATPSPRSTLHSKPVMHGVLQAVDLVEEKRPLLASALEATVLLAQPLLQRGERRQDLRRGGLVDLAGGKSALKVLAGATRGRGGRGVAR